MFWGLVIVPNKWHTQIVETPFHVSMATLDIATASNEMVQVMVSYDNTNYLLCGLKKDLVWQVPLDLIFQKGTKVTFTCNGQSNVYLTGYLKSCEKFDLNQQEENEGEDDDDNDYDEEVEIQRYSEQDNKYKLMQKEQQNQKKKQNKQKLVIGKSKKYVRK